MIDVDYNYKKDYFLVLLDDNIIKQTEELVFDNIDNAETPYHFVSFADNYRKTVFANNAEIVFCDEICDDEYEYIIEEELTNIYPFSSGILFNDGPVLLYDAMKF